MAATAILDFAESKILQHNHVWDNVFSPFAKFNANISHIVRDIGTKPIFKMAAFSSKWFFSKAHKILILNLRQLKRYTATHFRREFRTKLDKSTNSDNSETNCYKKIIILVNKPYVGLLCAN